MYVQINAALWIPVNIKMGEFSSRCMANNERRHFKKKFNEFEENKVHSTFAYIEAGVTMNSVGCQDTCCIMKDFYSNMTFLAVYDGHGHNGCNASEFANINIGDITFYNTSKRNDGISIEKYG
eukprot:TRINITY_DN15419_c0_g2_i3.p1 TRINITY_DN15419_c0_g2~~TRINITY_DN15419_c0_g2_i3.p1  ORF type:complete len:123 (+),score=13.69 TRINITY_DN15419_c0_g2_i3:32-400(+)